MNEYPLVSVIVPVYNCERYLKVCLNSIIGQSFKDIEVICVNDGSTDDSIKILKEYENKDVRVKIVTHTSNKGSSYARKTGIEKVRGRYVLFVDADDILESDAVKLLYEKSIELDSDITIMGIRRFVYNRVFHFPFSNPKDIFVDRCIDKQAIMGKYYPILLSKNGMPVSVIDKLYRTDLIRENIKILTDYVGDDIAFNAQIFLRVKKIAWIDYVGYNWRYSGDSKKYLIKYWEDLKLLYPKLLDIINSQEIKEEEKVEATNAVVYSRLTDLRSSVIQRMFLKKEKKGIDDFITQELNDTCLQRELELLKNRRDELSDAAKNKDFRLFKELSVKNFKEHKKFYTFMRIIDFLKI